ncbi:MAG TPA: tyrosine-type recombinase/integrase, partial [Candidatus Acidoferrum sp.]|nr:tyrosine-type recombinase/integrase [Candidatus Acidoferrum sp.]
GSVSAKLSVYFQRLGIDATCVSLRHRFVSRLYATNQHDLRMAQELAGHANIRTTAGYAKANMDRASEFVDKL